MLTITRVVLLAAAIVFAAPASAQAPVVANPDQASMLASPDPKLAANKRLVYDFWREVFEGLHMELAPKYLTEAYIQHNPSVPSGRAAFVDFFSKRGAPKAIESRVQAPLVSIVAERDLVIMVFAREHPDPKDATQKYTTTWFDMFRIENGKISEHWDPALKR
jgi:predicted SnoaL-like aldol condensation-catalyzing enzyme